MLLMSVDAFGAAYTFLLYCNSYRGCERYLHMLSMPNSGAAGVSAKGREELHQHSIRCFILRACMLVAASGYPVVRCSKRRWRQAARLQRVHADGTWSFWTGMPLHRRLPSLLGAWRRLSGGKCDGGGAPSGSEGCRPRGCFIGSGGLSHVYYRVPQI